MSGSEKCWQHEGRMPVVCMGHLPAAAFPQLLLLTKVVSSRGVAASHLHRVREINFGGSSCSIVVVLWEKLNLFP